ncbi:clathrin-coated vesicle protein [Paecilomyces variotii No. 5]|uniref:Clathrin-coated vesicle protein n=1 Tax=Byssochlamys spectabilis (strain No. 5 / NBRC 109023) TaxID=1356009 RepID=V5GAT7_BYSSN|nr:clathrin-coated vesicle protein [Paecilomyces variotii No. 5]
MTLSEEFRSRNFSIYGQWFVNIHSSPYVYIPYQTLRTWNELFKQPLPSQWSYNLKPLVAFCAGRVARSNSKLSWTGVICIVLCFALGIANIFSFNALRIVFSIVCLVCSFLIIFIEIPFLLRICPTSSKFDAFIRRFTTIWMRAAVYLAMSIVQWMSLFSGASSLIAAAVFLLIASLFYGLAGLKSQEFVGSKTLGGQGLAQMIV